MFLGTEMGAGRRPHVFAYSDDDRLENAALKTKSYVYRTLKQVLQAMGIDATDDLDSEDSPVGSHSIRKYASTWVRSNGISRDDKDHRG